MHKRPNIQQTVCRFTKRIWPGASNKTQMDTTLIRSKLADYNRKQLEKKKLDMEIKTLRDEIETGCFGTQSPDKEGTEKTVIAGCIIKRTCKLTRTLTKDPLELEQALQMLSNDKAREELIKTSFDLSVAAYRKLSESDRAIIDSILTIKLGAPTVTVEGDFSEL